MDHGISMTLSQKLREALHDSAVADIPFSTPDLMSLVDLTDLRTSASIEEIHALALKAAAHQVAAICVYPEALDAIPATFPLTRATVINFPSGNQPLDDVLNALDHIKTHHRIDEIDYVFPYALYLSGDEKAALSHAHTVYRRCQEYGLRFKVIMETGAFDSMESQYVLGQKIIDSGCDFLKTSTGKISQGATPSAVFALLSAIKNRGVSCGVKVSGGVRTLETALEYTRLTHLVLNKKPDQSLLRIGTSHLFST